MHTGYNAKAIFAQSKLHKEVIEKNLKINNIISLGMNLWTDKQLAIIEKNIGKKNARQPHKSGVEAEDTLYALPIITYFQLDYYFIFAASIGAPIFCIYVIKDYLGLKK